MFHINRTRAPVAETGALAQVKQKRKARKHIVNLLQTCDFKKMFLTLSYEIHIPPATQSITNR